MKEWIPIVVTSILAYLVLTLDDSMVKIKGPSGNWFMVRKGPDQEEAAKLLDKVRQNLSELVIVLNQMTHSDKDITHGIKILNQRHPPINLSELSLKEARHTIALNRGKGKLIKLCIRNSDGSLGSSDIATYLGVHELTHSMISSFAKMSSGYSIHNPLFKKIESYLMRAARENNIVSVQDYIGKSHCGFRIPNPNQAS